MSRSKVIRVEHLSKCYEIGKSKDDSLRGSISGFFKGKNKTEEFWALQDINFSVDEGEVVGIIGKNGAGKSTLLKVLSQITKPTQGRIELTGRVASLLEVGTGFHPELTGRENVYLNGTILGMSRKEVTNKFDEIVAFSGIEKFIDTPVKHYSSGMYVRLAFSVAAHLDPEILIIDEVLAVGDVEFQRKCLGKMKDVAGQGRTVLFVSHNMASVRMLCTRALVMNKGKLTFQGDVDEAVQLYLGNNSGNQDINSWDENSAPGNDKIKLLEISTTPLKGDIIDVDSGIKLSYKIDCQIPDITLGTTIELVNQNDVLLLHDGVLLSSDNDSKKGYYIAEFTVPAQLLNKGNYRVNLLFGQNRRILLLRLDGIHSFAVENSHREGDSLVKPGVIRPILEKSVYYAE